MINPVPSSKSSKNKEASFTQLGFTDAEVMSVFAADQQARDIKSYYYYYSFTFAEMLYIKFSFSKPVDKGKR